MEILTEITNAGVNLSVSGDNILVTPKSKLTSEQRQFLRINKAEIIKILKNKETFVTTGTIITFNDLHAPTSSPDSSHNAKSDADDRRYCRQCSNLNLRGYCTQQRVKPVDDMPRNCSDFIPNGKPAGLSPTEERAILRWLTWIGENNPDIISEVMDYCERDPAYREYYLMRSREVPTK